MLNLAEVDRIVSIALAEDVGPGDVTSAVTIPEDSVGRATFVAKAHGVLAGGPVLRRVFDQVDSRVWVTLMLEDGMALEPGKRIAAVEGSSRSILTAERTALNFLQHLSGIATRTSRFAELVAGTGARIVDTRKTVPGMRTLAKYAVLAGGGQNHRTGLFDGVLIKDNHIRACGGVRAAVTAARAAASHLLKVEVEADTLEQVQEALDARADIVLLDNMDVATLAKAVALCRGRALTEASGGVNEQTVRAIAEAGVDLISVGALTHSVTALDISLDWDS